MKYKLILSTLVLLSTYAFSVVSIAQNMLPSVDANYNGYRLALTNFTVDQREEWINIQFTTVNTGREDINLNNTPDELPIILNMEELLKNAILAENQIVFTETFLNSKLNIKAGEVLYNQNLKIKNNNKNNNSSDRVKNNILPVEIADVSLNNQSETYFTEKGTETGDDDNACPDLIIESVSIVKKSKNSVTLKYKIKNKGKKPLSVTGPSKKKEDNLALIFHMSSSEKLTRGSITIGGTFVKGGKQTPDGKLYPGKSLTEEIKLDISMMTRFTPVIILEIDPYFSIEECNETNNLNYIKVKK